MQNFINKILMFFVVILGIALGIYLMKLRFKPLYDLYTFIPKWIYKRYKESKKKAKELFKDRMDKEFEDVDDFVEVIDTKHKK